MVDGDVRIQGSANSTQNVTDCPSKTRSVTREDLSHTQPSCRDVTPLVSLVCRLHRSLLRSRTERERFKLHLIPFIMFAVAKRLRRTPATLRLRYEPPNTGMLLILPSPLGRRLHQLRRPTMGQHNPTVPLVDSSESKQSKRKVYVLQLERRFAYLLQLSTLSLERSRKLSGISKTGRSEV